jgi:dienelactone hydrolase
MTVLQIIGVIIGGLIGLYIIELAIVSFLPGFSVPKQPLGQDKQPTDEESAKPPQSRRDVGFEVKGTKISAWLYLPENLSAPVPCIIMAHGFGGTKDMLLEHYAVRYTEVGFAVLTFDYRHFGKSGGEPRQLMLIPLQLEDFRAAIEYARSLKEIDPAKIVLWGASASGGYGIVIAAKDKRIAGVVSVCPALDHKASEQMFRKTLGIRHMLRLLVHGQRDMMRSRLGLSAHKIPIVGKPGTMAFLPVLDAYEGYSKLVSENFVNEVCARVILRAHGFNPADHIKNIGCPVLIQICDYDSLAPISAETEKELRKYAEVKRYPIGHFDIYYGDNYEKAVSDQLEFFKKHL